MRDITTKQDNVGDVITAGQWNSNQAEFENLVSHTGQTLDASAGPDTDVNMMGKAAAIYGQAASTYEDFGSANTYTLSRLNNLESPMLISMVWL